MSARKRLQITVSKYFPYFLLYKNAIVICRFYDYTLQINNVTTYDGRKGLLTALLLFFFLKAAVWWLLIFDIFKRFYLNRFICLQTD